MSTPPKTPFHPDLREATVTLRLREGAVDFASLLAAYEDTPGISVRSDRGGLRGALRGNKGWGSYHTHFSLQKAASADYVVLELEVTSKSHGRFPSGVPTTSSFLTQIRGALHDPHSRISALIGLTYGFALNQWRPTFTLPFSLPGALDHIPGLPKISGVDFSFSHPTEEQQLIRAFVTTYDSIDEMLVRLMLADSVLIEPALLTSAADVGGLYLAKFAVPIDGESYAI